VLLSVILAQAILIAAPGAAELAVAKEGVLNTPCRSERQQTLIRVLREQYDGQTVLTAVGKWPCVMPVVGISFRNTLSETNRAAWRRLRSEPEKWAEWIIPRSVHEIRAPRAGNIPGGGKRGRLQASGEVIPLDPFLFSVKSSHLPAWKSVMTKNLETPFWKFHGLGNDFIIARGEGLPGPLPEYARSICDRHIGVGGDGFLVVLRPRNKKHDARVRFFNADGSEAEMSGNGIRCVGAFLMTGSKSKRTLELETLAGTKSLRLIQARGGKWTFRVGMGRPILDPRKIPFKGVKGKSPVVGFRLPTHRGILPVTITSMGNPHCSVFVADFAGIGWARLGREIESDPLFPRHTNVEFVMVMSRREIAVRFWERGVGETSSSGTGSCAAVVACVLNRRTGRKVRVRTLAGSLQVAWPERGEVSLTGPAQLIAQGTYHHQP
jgi:diaminopimelate epimerase